MTDRAADVWDRLVAKQVERFEEEAGWAAEGLRSLKLGSPIEAMFLAAFVSVRGWGEWVRVFDTENDGDDPCYVAEYGHAMDGASTRYDVWPQWRIDRYRVDFLIEYVVPWLRREGGGWRQGVTGRLVVECDGHDFHERTKEQAKRDRSMDRDLQQRGLMVLRFTGSEIHADANACAVEVCRALSLANMRDEKELPDRRDLGSRPR